MYKSTISLFNNIVVDEVNSELVPCESILKKFSCVVTKDVFDTFGENAITNILSKSLDIDKMNNTFFTFLQTVETSDEERYFHQMMHYLSTYGYENLTGGNNQNPYFPVKNVFPEYEGKEESIYVRIISGATIDMIKDKIDSFMNSTAGVNDAYVDMWSDIIRKVYSISEITDILNSGIRNKDFASIIGVELYPRYVPIDVEEMIRLAIFLEFGKATKITSKSVLAALNNSRVLDDYIKKYGDSVAIDNMAKVWRRNRKYLLAMKSRTNKSVVNSARKKADKAYKKVELHPVLNATVVDDLQAFKKALPNMNVSQLVRMYNACMLRTVEQEVFFTRIRNGSVWYEKKGLRIPENNSNFIDELQNEFMSRKLLDGKKVFIPSGVNMVVPSSSKDMVGMVPNFTSIDVDDSDIAIGVHWYNDGNTRIDLDLSYFDMNGKLTSWNSDWKNDDTIFSGDITDAPKSRGGASEFIVRKKGASSFGQFNLCMYNVQPVDLSDGYTYTLFVNKPKDLYAALEKKNDYLLNSGRTVFQAPISPNKIRESLGYLVGNRFVVSKFSIGSNNVAGVSDNDIIKYVTTNIDTKLSINNFIKLSGGTVVSDKDDSDISLDFGDLNTETYKNLKVF